MIDSVYKFECKYCHKKFKFEHNYLKHYCKEWKKVDLANSIEGEKAFALYQRWIKQSKGGIVKKPSFLTSRYFNAFIKISEFLDQVDIIDRAMYVDFMSKKKYFPNVWMESTAFDQFRSHLDSKIPPIKLIKISAKTISDESEDLGCDSSEYFDFVEPYHVLHLFETRKLSVWLLLQSSKFRTFVNKRLNQDQKIVMKTFLDSKKWAERYNAARNKKAREEVKRYLEALGL